MGDFGRRASYKAHERRSRGHAGPRSPRVIPRRGERQERIERWSPAKPRPRATDSAGAKILGVGARPEPQGEGRGNGEEGTATGRWVALPRRENRWRLEKPMDATGMKQGRSGSRRSNASRGRENPKALHSRVRQTRCGTRGRRLHGGRRIGLVAASCFMRRRALKTSRTDVAARIA